MKNLDTHGGKIKSFEVENCTENNMPTTRLTITCEKIYKFRVCQDEMFPKAEEITSALKKEIQSCKDTFGKLTTKSDKIKNRLFINGVQYTGQQLQ